MTCKFVRSNLNKADERKVTFFDAIWIFVAGSVAGFILEGLWHILRFGTWESHTATVWGPFCIIYGVGAVAAYFLSSKIKIKNIFFQFLIYAATGTVIEYLCSIFQEVCLGTSSWNYSGMFLNIGGRVTLFMSFLWGLLGISFTILVFPLFDKILNRMRNKKCNIAAAVVGVYMCINLLFTAFTILRWGERQSDLPASNLFEQYADENYDDERMQEIFPNMVFSK